MPDSAWDSEPPPRKRLSVLGKIFIGCGTAVLCFFLALGAMIWWGVNKATSIMDKGWAELHRDAEALRTVEGSRALYRANPGLQQDYATESAFLEAVAPWRPRLGEVPAQRPDFKTLFGNSAGETFGIKTHHSDGRKLTWLRLRMSTGAVLVVELDGEKLTDIHVD